MKKDLIYAVCLILIAVISRLVPHGWNFTAMGAVAVIAGFLISHRALAITTVLSALLISDAFIIFHNTMLAVYAGYILMTVVGILLSSNKNFKRILAASFIGSVSFFLVSNLGVWFEGQLYPQTWDGLVQCFTMAVPFFRNEALSTVMLSPVIYYSFTALAKAVGAEENQSV